jgi:selenide,water dikinase
MATDQSGIQLTKFSHGGGCGCKIEPAVLQEILSDKRSTDIFSQLLVGNTSNDDAAVWDMGNGMSMINTVDFFMPIVDDAFDFGRIAATNAISDIYAMGGKPVFANAILGWPVEKLPAQLAGKVLNGAIAVCSEAGIPLAGGHSIDSSEPIFGLSVNGLVATAGIKRNNTAKAGDMLFLTKPLGMGIIGSAVKKGVVSVEHLREAVTWMTRLNTVGSALSAIEGVHAMTDITGFSLLGHLVEMTEGSGVSAEIEFGKVPVLPFVDAYTSQNIVPNNTYKNWNNHEKKIHNLADMKAFLLLNDPQTSGGLLVSVAASAADEVKRLLQDAGLSAFVQPIGKIIEKSTFEVRVC